jgi:hypothetical protein
MTQAHEPARRTKLIEAIRWLCVLPAAALGSVAVQLLLAVLAQVAGPDGWRMFLYYVVREAAFVMAGALMAPRRRTATAIVLAVLAIAASLLKHILGQYLAGNHVGSVNYLHFCLESAGAVIGVAFVVLQNWRYAKSRNASSPA